MGLDRTWTVEERRLPPLEREPPGSPEPAPGRTAGGAEPAARYFPDFFLRAAQYAVIRSDTAFFSSGVI